MYRLLCNYKEQESVRQSENQGVSWATDMSFLQLIKRSCLLSSDYVPTR